MAFKSGSGMALKTHRILSILAICFYCYLVPGLDMYSLHDNVFCTGLKHRSMFTARGMVVTVSIRTWKT